LICFDLLAVAMLIGMPLEMISILLVIFYL
jgi:hypothetical protein